MLDETWEQNELVGDLIDIVEDYLAMYLREKYGDDPDEAYICGGIYDDLAFQIKDTLKNWGLISHT